DPAAALASSDFDTVWQILQSLRSIDGHFDAMINTLALRNRERTAQDKRKGSKTSRNGMKRSDHQDVESLAARTQEIYQGDLDLDEQVSTVFQARLVAHCGTTGYWDDWGGTVANIYEKTRKAVEGAVGREGEARNLFHSFLESLRGTLNPQISVSEAVSMISSHLVTGPIFDALFGQRTDAQGRCFADLNPVSRAMAPLTTVLRPLVEEADGYSELERLYAQVRVAARACAADPVARVALVRDLYEKFFKTAFEADAKRLGVVYTPTGIVDWIEHAADRLLKQHFGLRLRDEGVNILDPFAGTGTFIARLLSNSLIPAQDLERKYERELWANEIMPLAYYIAIVNIESEYAAARRAAGLDYEYEPFPGGCLTDTFRSTEDARTLDSRLFGENNERVEQENRTPITVIVANPPYSAGQKDANDGNANEHYPVLDQRIAETYIAHAEGSSNTRQIYDSYIRAFRWASDRIAGPDGTGRGVIGFVSGGGWLRNTAFDGFRRSLCDEFSDIWVVDLRGNKEFRRLTRGQLDAEGGNVFGSASKSPIAVTLLVRDPGSDHHGRIHYH
ncbi:MAG: N-6 DNA methylase, partial [Aeriscardovia sp.]|nr:N-6 DNA methylase [Aeriscardovia sp.]